MGSVMPEFEMDRRLAVMIGKNRVAVGCLWRNICCLADGCDGVMGGWTGRLLQRHSVLRVLGYIIFVVGSIDI